MKKQHVEKTSAGSENKTKKRRKVKYAEQLAEVDEETYARIFPAFKWQSANPFTPEELEILVHSRDPLVRRFAQAHIPLHKKIERMCYRVRHGQYTKDPTSGRPVNINSYGLGRKDVIWLMALNNIEEAAVARGEVRGKFTPHSAIRAEIRRMGYADAVPINGDYSRTRYFGVAEPEQVSASSGRTNGWWRTTKKGRLWLKGKIKIDARCLSFNNMGFHLYQLNSWSVQDAWGKKKFNYAEMRNNLPDEGLAKVEQHLRNYQETGKLNRPNYGVKKPKKIKR